VIKQIAFHLLDAFNALVLVYFTVLNTTYLLMSLIAFREIRHYIRRIRSLDLSDLLTAEGVPPVTIIAPAYNEEPTCVEAVRSLLTIDYAQYEVLIVNDGSTDGTLQRLREEFALAPAARLPTSELPTAAIRRIYQSRAFANLWVVDKENGGKADALNAGVNLCLTPLFCAVDADSLLERDALTRIVRPFLEDARTVAAGGVIRIVNGCTVKDGNVVRVRLPDNIYARFQVLEYLRSFLAGRMSWQALGATLIISGAFGIFRRQTVVAAGGYASKRTGGATVGEDMELVVRLHHHCLKQDIPYRIVFVPDPVAWTECPETLRGLARQRDRWQRGMVEVLTRHWRMHLNPKYGRVGMLAFPYFVFLETAGLLVEIAGYIAFALTVVLGRASGLYVIGFLAAAFAFGMALSIAAVALEELGFRRYPARGDLLRLFLLATVENLGYRQFISLWRLRGLISALRGVTAWGERTRRGFDALEPTPRVPRISEAAAPVPAPGPAIGVAAGPARTSAPVDIEELRRSVGDDLLEVAETIMRVFAEDAPMRMAAIEQAMEIADRRAIRATAHAYRGAAATVRAGRLARLLGEAEAAADEGRLDAARALLPELRATHVRVLEFLAAGSQPEA
jgi:cellulose synthase/poly-beta-1,6-N-acetylglucosamine synthase-like glycosyltransferase/HPt (histidine-containing phosphotransfer) domain-containing protein